MPFRDDEKEEAERITRMRPALKVFPGDDERSRLADQTLDDEPRPIQFRPMHLEDGRIVNLLIWFNDEAARCRACPSGTCTFSPTATGVGSCIVRCEGGLGPPPSRLSSGG